MTNEEKFQEEIAAEIEKKIKDARMQGILIGWNAYAMQAYKRVSKMHSIKEVKAYFKEEANTTIEKLNMQASQLTNSIINQDA